MMRWHALRRPPARRRRDGSLRPGHGPGDRLFRESSPASPVPVHLGEDRTQHADQRPPGREHLDYVSNVGVRAICLHHFRDTALPRLPCYRIYVCEIRNIIASPQLKSHSCPVRQHWRHHQQSRNHWTIRPYLNAIEKQHRSCICLVAM